MKSVNVVNVFLFTTLCLATCFYAVFGKLKLTAEAWKMPEENTGERINAIVEDKRELRAVATGQASQAMA